VLFTVLAVKKTSQNTSINVYIAVNTWFDCLF